MDNVYKQVHEDTYGYYYINLKMISYKTKNDFAFKSNFFNTTFAMRMRKLGIYS